MSLSTGEVAVPRRKLYVTMAALVTGQLIGSLNATLVTAALPTIIVELNATAVQGTWLITAAVISMTVAAPIWGRLGDQVNPMILLRVSLGGLILAAILATTAQNPVWLLLARTLHALSLSGTMALTMILFALLVSPRERGRYMGLMSAVGTFGMMAGPFIGGLIVQSIVGWRGVFGVGIPLAIIVLVLLELGGGVSRKSIKNGPRIDFLGGFLIAGGVATVLIYVSFGSTTFGYTSPIGLAMLVAGVAALVVALFVELRHERPVLPIRAMRGKVVRIAAIAALGAGMTGFPLAMFISLYLQSGRGLSPTLAGLMIGATAVGSVASSFLVGHLTTRTARLTPFLRVGGVFLLGGSILLAFISQDTPYWWLVFVLFLCGLGQGATTQFTTLAAQNATPIEQVGGVTGFMQFVQSVGGAVLMAVLGGLLQVRLNELKEAGVPESEAYTTVIPQFFVAPVAFAAVALLCYLLLPAIRLRDTIDQKGTDEDGDGVPDDAPQATSGVDADTAPADTAAPEGALSPAGATLRPAEGAGETPARVSAPVAESPPVADGPPVGGPPTADLPAREGSDPIPVTTSDVNREPSTR